MKHLENLPDMINKIVDKRLKIRNIFSKQYKVRLSNLVTKDLRYLFNLYDDVYFSGEYKRMIKSTNTRLQFGFLPGTDVMGLHSYTSSGNTCKLSISRVGISKLFSNNEKRLWVNGLNVRDRLEALQVVFEHEMVHMYMVLRGWSNKIKSGKGKMYYSSHGKLFQELAKRFFLHTDYRHALTNGESTGHLTKDRCKVGMNVIFTFKHKKCKGVIIKCNPRNAKVESLDETIIWTIPYQCLKMFK